MTAIQITDLRKTYGSINALDGLTLAVETGTVFGFLGPNGAGKSTTLRILTGLARPTSGQAQIAGVDITRRGEIARRIGYLPEEPAFYGWMNPAEFLDHVARTFGMNAAQRKVRAAELLAQVGLSDVSKRRIAGFSRGMRQRLGLAQAMINHPAVLLLDEPVSALDPVGRKEVLQAIQTMRGQTTIFMSTHILADVERVCDTVAIIDHGKLVVEAPQAELLARYTIPAYELECEPGSEAPFKVWASGLTGQPWVASVIANGGSARVIVNDLAAARSGLLPLAAASGLPLRRFEVVTPSLEDIFMRLVKAEEK